MAEQPSKIAVITGGGSGIGAAVALALAGDGWVVVLAGRRPQALASVAERGAGLPGALDPVPTDVTDEGSVQALSSDDFGSSVERQGGCHPVYGRWSRDGYGPWGCRGSSMAVAGERIVRMLAHEEWTAWISRVGSRLV